MTASRRRPAVLAGLAVAAVQAVTAAVGPPSWLAPAVPPGLGWAGVAVLAAPALLLAVVARRLAGWAARRGWDAVLLRSGLVLLVVGQLAQAAGAAAADAVGRTGLVADPLAALPVHLPAAGNAGDLLLLVGLAAVLLAPVVGLAHRHSWSPARTAAWSATAVLAVLVLAGGWQATRDVEVMAWAPPPPPPPLTCVGQVCLSTAALSPPCPPGTTDCWVLAGQTMATPPWMAPPFGSAIRPGRGAT